jgi:hypothetical protein
MSQTNDQNNNPKDDNNTLIEIDIKASTELRDLITIMTEAGRVIVKVGRLLVPLLLASSVVFPHVLPQSTTTPQPAIEATQESQK